MASTVSNHELSTDVLLEFFRDGYGDRYLGDKRFLEDYINRADRSVTLGVPNRLRAAALLRASRLTAVATAPNHEVPNSYRRDTMIELLRASRALQPDGWITIHSAAHGMQQAAKAAGMLPLHNQKRMVERLDAFGELSTHTITPSPEGLIIARDGSYHGGGYLQHAWGWED